MIPRPPGQPPRLAVNPQRPPGQPSRPPNKPSRPLRPQSGQPTPPLRTSQRPFVFPTASTSIRGGEPVIVTGVAIPAENDVIDLTVTAQQGFGGRRPPKKKYTGFDRIITKARPGDQFVSIDGKRTYFDIEPTKAPSVTRPRPAGQGAIRGATLQIGGKDVYKSTRKTYDKN